jgi:putative DNA methylase
MKDDKRLIEDYLPIKAISAEGSREKNLRKGHVSSLHLWWARRPLVACRAAVYGALVPVSRFVWTYGSKNAHADNAQNLGRKEAEKFVEALCKYPGDSSVIREAQQHILEAHAERLSIETGREITSEDIAAGRAPRPKVLDMFAGGGSIPLEALRLGCEAYALDLNPVAYIIELCTLVYPQRYGQPDDSVRGMTGPKNHDETTWGGLAAEIRYWGNWILEKVKQDIGDLYPLISDPTAKPHDLISDPRPVLFPDSERQQRLKASADYVTPIAYLWTRTVRCINPSCGATVPLVKQTWLNKSEGYFAAIKVVAPKGEKCASFRIAEAKSASGLGFDPDAFSKGGNASCPFCGTVSNSDYVKVEGLAGRIGHQLMAVICGRPNQRGKFYLAADCLRNSIPSDEEIRGRIEALCTASGLTVPDEPIINDAKSANFCVLYGLTKFSDLFNPRQLLCLLSFAATVRMAGQEMEHRGYESDHVKAIMTFLAAILDRLADFNSVLCVQNYLRSNGVAHTFGRQSIPMVWDYAETNPFNPGSASWISGVRDLPEGLRDAQMSLHGKVQRASATALPHESNTFDAVITDPPYYDNVPYADISDFFYVWLKRSIGHLYTEHFSTEGTPKKKEAVADAVRHDGDRQKAKRAYESMMAQAFAEANRVLKKDGQMIVVYAHKTTLGWATLVDALRQASFTVTEAWPLDTEKPGRLRSNESAALASSIFLIARKRDGVRTGQYETEVKPELERIVRERVETLWDLGISGADLVIAAVGAGLRAVTRFARVEYANGEEVPAEGFLTEVEGVVLETLLEKIFGFSRSGVAKVDPASRFYVLWRYAYKATELDAGEAIVFAYPQSVELDGAHGLTQGRSALVERKKNKYRLRDYTERGAREDLGLADEDSPNGGTSLIDILHRILWLMENEPRKLNGYLEQALPDRERLRQVAQALAGPALKGGEDGKLINTTSAEAGALGKLLANWRTLIDARLEEFRLR